MKKYKSNYSFLLAMAFKEKGKLLIAILDDVISTLLSYVPYFMVFQVITKLISRTAVVSELITLAGIGIGAVIVQAAQSHIGYCLSCSSLQYSSLNTVKSCVLCYLLIL